MLESRDLKSAYPETSSARSEWILGKRAPSNHLDPNKPFASIVEEERSESGEIVQVATVFLTNRECPWRCLYCDLWKNTLTESVPVGAIPNQIDFALDQDSARTSRQIKLYNSGSFFDPRAIPIEDYPAIAERVRSFERIIVECHPALIGESAVRFRDLTGTKLEVAIGLETVHPKVLPKLNKQMTLEHFSKAAAFLQKHDIALRTFILVKPPFLNETEALEWAKRSIDFAFDQGTTVVSLIPTRLGNGALEALAEQGDFSQPKLGTLEAAMDYGASLERGRVFADLWDLERFSECSGCFRNRQARLGRMNVSQTILKYPSCAHCKRTEKECQH